MSLMVGDEGLEPTFPLKITHITYYITYYIIQIIQH